jgi:predicted kinase
MTHEDNPQLFIFSGLPASGKSTLSQMLTRQIGATHLRVDVIEQALRDLLSVDVKGEGYEMAYRLAADQLRLGMCVVADSCNPIALTRDAWQRVATDSYAGFINIEVICSDLDEHRRRVETREVGISELKLPNWEDVMARVYEPWDRDRIVVDTAGRTPEDCMQELVQRIER